MIFFIITVGLAMVNLYTKLEVSMCVHYDMKSGRKCTNWDSLGRSGVTQGHRQCHHSIERIQRAIQLWYKQSIYLVPFSRYSQLFVEIRRFWPTPPAFGTAVGGRILLRSLRQKTRFPGLSCGVVCVILCLAVLVEHRLVTDTDSEP